MKFRTLILLAVVALAGSISAFAGVNIIPYPQSVEMTETVFNKKNLDKVKFVKAKELPVEAYELQICKNKVVVAASSEAGYFYALQTLNQLAEADVMYCGTIKDAPRYEWRGMMFDESRHFFGKEKVKNLLDLMARYKLNRLHWHLSDNQSWRVEIKAYPKLCEIGAIGNHTDRNAPAKFYTQDEIREVVAYAAERHIEIIPEIDMPGHTEAFGKAFPDLYAGYHTVNVANPKLYEVLEVIMKELADLFPGRYIHIGGDEVSRRGWRSLPEMPEFMAKNNIATYDDIQTYFEVRFSEIITKVGKIAIAWDDVINGDMNKENTILHWWQSDRPQNLQKSLEYGYRTIFCPWGSHYLDYVQDARCKEGQLVEKGFVNDLRKLYEYKYPDNPLVMGAQVNLWTERVYTDERFGYMVFPRLIALAENAWSPEANLNYEDFLERLANEYKYAKQNL